jgi:hypothetical protein
VKGEGRLKNLKPFNKGYDSRRDNGGRPPGSTSISAEMKKILSTETSGKDVDGAIRKMSTARQIAVTAVARAIRGDTRMTEILLDRNEGKVVQPVENVNTIDLTSAAQEKLEALFGKLKDA